MKKNKLLGMSLMIIGLLLPIREYLINIYMNRTKEARIVSYLKATSITNIPNESTHHEVNDQRNDYIAILEIPAISLKKGLVDIANEFNDIEYNIAIMESSNLPNIKNSNLILAAHNGNSPVSFFKDLEMLGIGEHAYIYYNGYKYTYQIANYYVVEKKGTINITRDMTKNTLTLITCKNDSDTEQIVYIGYLIDQKAY